MAESMMWCENKQPDGVCKCNGEYCVEGPCHYCKPVEYAPVRYGRWREVRNVSYDDFRAEDVVWFTYVCSECEGEPMSDYTFCPFCGAKMDGDEHG